MYGLPRRPPPIGGLLRPLLPPPRRTLTGGVLPRPFFFGVLVLFLPKTVAFMPAEGPPPGPTRPPPPSLRATAFSHTSGPLRFFCELAFPSAKFFPGSDVPCLSERFFFAPFFRVTFIGTLKRPPLVPRPPLKVETGTSEGGSCPPFFTLRSPFPTFTGTVLPPGPTKVLLHALTAPSPLSVWKNRVLASSVRCKRPF